MRRLAAVLCLTAVAAAQGAADRTRPYLGYLCAAGGQRGTVVRIVAGGQNLRGAREVIVSGTGVRATVLDTGRAPWLLDGDQRRDVGLYLRRLAARRVAELARGGDARGKAPVPPEGLPDLPLLQDPESLSLRELRRVAYEYLDPARRSQLSAQIAEVVRIEVTIDADATPGDRELRVRTPGGLTNPMLFEVGEFPEYAEREPNDFRTTDQPPVDAPCVFNGQVSFKDVDHFRFLARRGQSLVVEVQARRLVPYLADAVPGWFQATLSLRDADGGEVAFVDDFGLGPDPVLRFEVPRDGLYEIAIADALSRGRVDFVYRVTVSERPFVRSIFPLGGRAGSETVARLEGWNLASRTLRLDTAPGGPAVRAVGDGPALYAVDDLPEVEEGRGAAALALPCIVNGRIARPGEVDRYALEGRAGDELVAEVNARRLGSPLDSLLQLVDSAGRVIAWNDDHVDPAAGLVTHQADSWLRATLPADGAYAVLVRDAEGHGGGDFGYRLRVGPPRPDFTLLVTPSSIDVPEGGHAEVTAHVVRRDGFDGPVSLELAQAPPGTSLSGAVVPAGCDRVRMTLAAPPRGRRRAGPATLRVVGTARIGGQAVLRAAVPADERMQAFGLLHLVPARELMMDTTRTAGAVPGIRLVDPGAVGIPAGGSAEVRVAVPGLRPEGDPRYEVSFALDRPPPGVALREVRRAPGELVLVLDADAEKAGNGLAGNLIVVAQVTERLPEGKRAETEGAKKPPARRQRTLRVLLPAVPFTITR